MRKAIDAILIKLPKINDEWAESVAGQFYNAGWEEFRESYPETHNLLDEPQEENLPIQYVLRIHSYIPGYIKEIFEEHQVPRMWGVQLTSIEDIEMYNKLVQSVCSRVANLIHLFVRDFLEDGDIGKEMEIEYSDDYSEEENQPNIYEEEVDDV